MSSGNRPIQEIKLARIRASIWTNKSGHSDTWFNASIAHVYRDGGHGKRRHRSVVTIFLEEEIASERLPAETELIVPGPDSEVELLRTLVSGRSR